MGIRFASLGSGSKGNAWIVESGNTRVMVDCGFAGREAERRLARLGLELDAIDALLITHEHSDHGRGAMRVARAARCSAYMSHGCHAMLAALGEAPDSVSIIGDRTSFAIGDIQITPYPVPHDAREPLQFVFTDGATRFGMLTDAGHVTAHMQAVLADCDALALECNHDRELLAGGRYPETLKRRIGGPYGHLDNAATADLLRRVRGPRLRQVVAAHLSQENNRPELARAALSGALDCSGDWIGVADQEQGLDWRTI